MYENFIPNVWAEAIERDLERHCVFAEDCHRKYEGKIKKQGESVTILGIGKPTIKHLTRKDAGKKIDDAETIEDTSLIMPINQFVYFNYKIDDIDKAQAVGGVMEALKSETTEGLANDVDKYIAKLAADSNVKRLYETAPVIVGESPTNGEVYVLDAVDEAVELLQEEDVADSTEIIITISPKFRRRFKKAYRLEDTDNSNILKHGRIGKYDNVTVKISNNIYRDGVVDNIPIRTKRAIAYANPFTHVEAYRPESYFCDAVKGYTLYDAKIVRPKEIININCKY